MVSHPHVHFHHTCGIGPLAPGGRPDASPAGASRSASWADVIGLYLEPPQYAVVFCVDEKPASQALDRFDPVLPLSPGAGRPVPAVDRSRVRDESGGWLVEPMRWQAGMAPDARAAIVCCTNGMRPSDRVDQWVPAVAQRATRPRRDVGVQGPEVSSVGFELRWPATNPARPLFAKRCLHNAMVRELHPVLVAIVAKRQLSASSNMTPRLARRIRTTASRSHACFAVGALVGGQHKRCRWHVPSCDLQVASTSH